MKLLAVAACIFLMTIAACGDKAPAKKDSPAPSAPPAPFQDTPTDEVASSEEDKAEDEMESNDDAVDEMESDDEVEDDTDNEDEDEAETAVQGDDQEFDDDVTTIGADEVNDAKPGLFSRWARRRRQKCVYHKGFHCKLAKLHGKSCKVCYDPERVR